MKIYTIGYGGRTPQEIKRIMDRTGAVLVDVRYSPNSRLPQWRQGALERLFGERYLHVQAFGNANYRSNGPVKLVDYEAGKLVLGALNGRPALLMCACADPVECHRTHIAGLLQADGFEVAEFSEELLASPQMELL